jgi:hypothetical protein
VLSDEAACLPERLRQRRGSCIVRLAFVVEAATLCRVRFEASADLRLMRHPFAAYRVLGEQALSDPERNGWAAALGGGLRWLLVVACFVSWTTHQHLLVEHLVLAPLAWAWAPALQTGWIAIAGRCGRATLSSATLVTLYHRGHGPWFVALLGVAAFSMLGPDPVAAFVAGWLLPLAALGFIAAVVWSLTLTYALFRAAAQLTRKRAAIAMAVYYLGVTGSILAYYAIAGQLAPILGMLS